MRTLLAFIRPWHTIAKQLTRIADLYEMDLANRVTYPGAMPQPLIPITEKPKRGDVTVSYQGDAAGPRWKELPPEWDEGPEDDVRD